MTRRKSSSTFPAARGRHGSASSWPSAGVVRDPTIFRAALLISGRARALKAGEYRFTEPMHALDVIDKIARGDVYKRLLTFREGLTIAEMAQVFEDKGFGKADEFRKAATNSEVDRRSRSGGAAISKATCFPKPTRCRETRRRRPWSSRWSRGSRMRCRRRCARPPKAGGLSVRQAGHARIAGREGDRRRRRTAAGRRGVSQPDEDRAWGCRPIRR